MSTSVFTPLSQPLSLIDILRFARYTTALVYNDSEHFSVKCHGCLTTTSTMQPPVAQQGATSVSSCVDLGWPSYNTGFPDVCAASIVNSTCFNTGTLSHDMAEAVCTGTGARLCTHSELQNDVTAGSGCNLDSQLIWTSTTCTGGFYAARGLDDGAPPVCADANTGLSVRCCADHFTTPTPNPSAAEAVSIVGYTSPVLQGQTGSVTVKYTAAVGTDTLRISFKQGSTTVVTTVHAIPDNVADAAITVTFNIGTATVASGYSLYLYITPDTFANRAASATSASDIAVVAAADALTVLSYDTQVINPPFFVYVSHAHSSLDSQASFYRCHGVNTALCAHLVFLRILSHLHLHPPHAGVRNWLWIRPSVNYHWCCTACCQLQARHHHNLQRHHYSP